MSRVLVCGLCVFVLWCECNVFGVCVCVVCFLCVCGKNGRFVCLCVLYLLWFVSV